MRESGKLSYVSQAHREKVFSPFRPEVEAAFAYGIDPSLIVSSYADFGVEVRRFFDGIDQVGVYECPLTKYRFYYPPTLAGDARFYEELQDAESTYYVEGKLEFDLALEKLSEGERVLEVGCGSGIFLEMLRSKNIEGVGLEFNDLAVEKCSDKGLDVRKEPISAFSRTNSSQFDAVVLFQVLEHIVDVAGFIRDLLACLKPGGKLIFAVPDNSPFYKNFRVYLTFNLPPHHMGMWNAKSFKHLEDFFPVSLKSVEYDDDYSSFANYVYHCGDLILTRLPKVYKNRILRDLLIVGLLPFTIPVVIKMKLFAELRPHSIIATFVKNKL